MTQTLSSEDVRALAQDCLTRAGLDAAAAHLIATDTAEAEASGDRERGILALLRDIRLLRYGRLLPAAEPSVTRTAAGIVAVDAGHGFASAAIASGIGPLCDAAHECGSAILSVRRASAAPNLSRHLMAIAAQGLEGTPVTRPTQNANDTLADAAMLDRAGLAAFRRDVAPVEDSPLGGAVDHSICILAFAPALLGGADAPAISKEPSARAATIIIPSELIAQLVAA